MGKLMCFFQIRKESNNAPIERVPLPELCYKNNEKVTPNKDTVKFTLNQKYYGI